MRLYYTTTQGVDGVQNKTHLSLGGYKSLSPVPNGQFSNLFGEISQITITSYNQNSYIGLILKNDLAVACNNVKLWFDYPNNCYSKLRVAVVQLNQDSNGQLYMENIPDKYTKPLYITEFVEADGEGNKINVASFAVGAMVGIWFERELLLDLIKQDQETPYELQVGHTDRYQEKDLGNQDDIKLNLSWD